MSTPLADDHSLYHSDYLLGPVETIVYSHQALVSGLLSVHDITEAYHTLSMRIRRLSCHLSSVSDAFPALNPLRDKDAEVAAALRRDISWALRISAAHTSGDLSLGSTESSTLCHYALRLLSEIFRLPALSSVFASQDLGYLLGDTISIVRRPQLRVLSSNASKTAILSSWVLRTQRLPKDVLRPWMEDLILFLNFILEAAVRDACVVVAVVDAFSCIVNLLTFHRHNFIEHLTSLLPSIFPIVIHKSSELRHHAAIVLASFSHTLVTYRSLVGQDTIETICVHTHSFLTPETTRHPTSSRRLPPLLDAAVSSKNFGTMGGNSPWASTVVASFAVLLGPSLFLHHGPLKLVMNVARKALRHRPGRDLNPHVWRTFIWSMVQLYTQQNSTAKGDIDVVQRCVLVLKQTLHAGLGAALISSLLEATSTDTQNEIRPGWVIPCVIDILRDMLSSKYEDIRDEACRILGCLTRGAGSISDTQCGTGWAADALLSRFLFDGSLLHADKVQVEEMMGPMRVFSPRRLSQEEILTHWNPISSCFVLVVQNSFKDVNVDLTSMVLTIWQSLVAQLQLVQSDGQLTASADFGPRLSSFLSQLLPDPLVPLSGGAESIVIQLQSLIISKQLWDVIQGVFPQTCLESIASSFLTAILRREFYLTDQEVLTNWSLLCSTLIVVGIPKVLEAISHLDEAQRALEVKRQLWRLMATHCDSSNPIGLQNLIPILVFPIGSWNLVEDDLDIWERVLEQNISAADTPAKTIGVIDGITSKCPEIGPSFPMTSALRVALIILRHLDVVEGGPLPTKTFSYLRMTLTCAYPLQSCTVDATCKLLKDIRHMIMSIPVSSLEPVILALQTGLAAWIEDKLMSLSAEQYNILLMPLYDSLLLRLQSLPISATSLNALVPLLTAAFSHIPPPALGPAAFRRFFYAVHARLAAPSDAYSDELRVCIDACVRGYGGEWPSGMVPLSSSSQTQTQTQMQTQFQIEARLSIEVSASPASCARVAEQIPYVRSIEHEIIPDSQCVISNIQLCASSPARMTPGPVQESLQFGAFISPCAQTRLCPIPVLSDPLKESPKLHEPTRPYDSSVSKKRRLPQDMPQAKRHCTSASPTGRLCTRSVPSARSSLPVIRSPRSRSTPRSFPHNGLVMDCVEVMPLRELLHRRKADAEGDDVRKQRRSGDLDDHPWDVTPSRPFMPRVRRELPERDEIVPETPDAVLRPTRIPLLTDQELSPRNDSPTRLLRKAQPLDRARTTSTSLVAALHEVHDVLSHPGLSQIPETVLADSARLLDDANKRLQMALVRGIQART